MSEKCFDPLKPILLINQLFLQKLATLEIRHNDCYSYQIMVETITWQDYLYSCIPPSIQVNRIVLSSIAE